MMAKSLVFTLALLALLALAVASTTQSTDTKAASTQHTDKKVGAPQAVTLSWGAYEQYVIDKTRVAGCAATLNTRCKQQVTGGWEAPPKNIYCRASCSQESWQIKCSSEAAQDAWKVTAANCLAGCVAGPDVGDFVDDDVADSYETVNVKIPLLSLLNAYVTVPVQKREVARAHNVMTGLEATATSCPASVCNSIQSSINAAFLKARGSMSGTFSNPYAASPSSEYYNQMDSTSAVLSTGAWDASSLTFTAQVTIQPHYYNHYCSDFGIHGICGGYTTVDQNVAMSASITVVFSCSGYTSGPVKATSVSSSIISGPATYNDFGQNGAFTNCLNSMTPNIAIDATVGPAVCP